VSLASTTRVRSARAALAVVFAVAALSCVEGDPTGTGRAVSIDIAPSFQVLPSDFASGPIDGIRLTALEASSLEVAGSVNVSVDPTADEWAVELAVDLGGATSMSVFVEVELTSGGVVEWSGRLGPITVGRSLGGGGPYRVEVFRGPLDNLDVESVTIVEPPTQILVGGSAPLGATVQLIAGSDAQPSLFWVSLDPAVATVMADVEGAFVLGMSPGIVTIAVGAGPAVDEVELEVLPRVQSVDVTPATASVDGLGVQIPYAATVTDGFGQPAPEEPITWSTSDPVVATVDDGGLVTSVGFGTVRVRATAAGVTGEGTLTVRGPDLVPTEFVVTPDGIDEIVDFVATGFDVTVTNQGAVVATATTLGIRVLDATLGTEVHPTLQFAIPPLNPGESHSFSATPEGQAQPVELPSLLRFEGVADFGQVVDEEDETNNVATSTDIGVQPPLFTKTWVGGALGAPNDWDTPENWVPAGVPTAADRVFVQSVPDPPVLSSSVTVASLELGDAMAVNLGGFDLSVSGALRAVGEGVVNGTVTITGTEGALEGILDGLVIAADRPLSGPLFLMGDLTMNGGALGVGPSSVTVGGDLLVTGETSRLVMQNGEGVVDVGGSATFDGGSHVDLLTAGTLVVRGDFTATSSSSTSFVGAGTHTVILDGSLAQTVFLSSPGTTQQRFQNLTVQNFTDGVAFASRTVVMGTFFSDDVKLTRAASDALLDLRGIAQIRFTEVVGLPVALTSTSGGPSHEILFVTFSQMSPADVQLRVELPGLGVNFPLLLDGMTFDSPDFTTGAHLEAVRGSGVDLMVVELVGPTPANGIYIQNTGTEVIW
jgi:hypothetical protein